MKKLATDARDLWEEYLTDAVEAKSSVKSGALQWLFLNPEVAERAQIFEAGLYIYTTESHFGRKMWKVGQTMRGVQRCFEQSGSAMVTEVGVIVDLIPHEKVREDSKYDVHIHKTMEERYSTFRAEAAGHEEWSEFPNRDPQTKVRVAMQWLDRDTSAGRDTLALTEPQMMALDDALHSLNAGQSIMLYELAARFGKTIWALSLFQQRHERVFCVASYVLSALSSFEKEVIRFTEFSSMVALDARASDFSDRYRDALTSGRKVVVLCSLIASDTVEERYRVLKGNEPKLIFIDEADFGAHRESAMGILYRYIRNEQDPIILGTGTNGARAISNHKVGHYFGVTYFDMLVSKARPSFVKPASITLNMTTDMRSIPEVEFYQIDFTQAVTDAPEDPSWSKVCQNPTKASGFIRSVFKTLLEGEGTAEYLVLENLFGAVPKGVMCFLPGSTTNANVGKVAEIAAAVLPNWHVVTLNGDFTSGWEAEEYTRKAIRRAARSGKSVLVISSGMGSRSYSIPEIDTVVLLYDNGSAAATGQKMSRCLTRGQDLNKVGRIVSVSLDPTRDDKLDAAIVETAVKVAERTDLENFNEAVRAVLRSLNIFTLDANGDKVRVEVDEYAARILNSKTLSRVIGKTANYDGLWDDPTLIQHLTNMSGEASVLGKSEIGNSKGEKWAEKKEKKESGERSANSEKKLLELLIAKIDFLAVNAHFVSAIANTTGFVDAVEKIKTDAALSQSFFQEFQIDVRAVATMVEKGILNGHLLDLAVGVYRNEQGQARADFWN
jgi:hypothetical protein